MTKANGMFLYLLVLLNFGGWHAYGVEIPSGTVLSFEGKDAFSNQPCWLFVTELGYSGPEQTPQHWYAIVQTSYSHGQDRAAAFHLKIHPGRPEVLFATGTNGKDQIAVFLEPAQLDLRNAKSFNLRWMHIDHLHTNRCLNLTVHQK